MNAQAPDDKEKKPVFKSIRFEPELAERLGDYVHEKKKRTKTSIDAEVQEAVRIHLDWSDGIGDPRVALELLDAYTRGSKLIKQQLQNVLNEWREHRAKEGRVSEKAASKIKRSGTDG